MQVAAHAAHHVRVRKCLGIEGRPETVVEPLVTAETKSQEIAAMMGVPYGQPG